MAGMLSFEMEVNAALGELTDVSPAPRLETGAKKRPRNANGAVKTGKKREEVKQLSVFGEKESDGCDKRTSDLKDIEDAVKDAVISAKKSVSNNGYEPRIISLASGSRANCTLIDGGETKILIDFGLSCRMLGVFLKKYGLDISDIDAIFITHEHIDHVYGLSTLFKKYGIPVHMTEPSYIAYTRKSGFDYRDKIVVHEVEYTVEIGGFTVSSCEVCHDSAACVSYLVEGNGVSFCTCTDLGFVPDRVFAHMSRAENVILESNHDVTLLETGEYPDELKRRIRSRSGHLSNEQCDDALVRLVCAGVKRILLGHISPENNDPELALHAAIVALDKAGQTVDYIGVAPRLEPIVLLGE